MSRGSIILVLLLVLLVAGAFILANMDNSIPTTRIEKAVSADAQAK